MRIKLLIIFLLGPLLVLSPKVSGQSFCGTTGGFVISPPEGCAPLTIKVENRVSKPENLYYAYKFDRKQQTIPDPKDRSQDSTYTYTLPGRYTILQYGSAGGTGFSSCLDIVVKETRAPSSELRTCQNGFVRLTIINDSIAKSYDNILIDWKDGKSEIWVNGKSEQLTHTYPPNTPIPSIVVLGQYADGRCQDKLSTKPPVFIQGPESASKVKIRSVEMQADGSVKLLYEGIDDTSTEVLIDKGSGTFESTGKRGKTGGPQAVTIDNLDPKKKYRFKLASKDICNDVFESGIVSSVVLKEGSVALDEINSLAWEHAPNTDKLIEYQVKRDGAVIFTTQQQLTYLDKNVKCGNSYKYEIVAIIEGDVRSYSAPIQIEPKTSPPGVIDHAIVSVESDNLVVSSVQLSGEGLTSTYDVIVERAGLGSQDFKRISAPGNQSLQYKDSDVNASSSSYCYRFSYQNACKLSSPSFSQPVCSILLQRNSQGILWNPDSPFTEAVASYDLIQMDQAGTVTDETPKALETVHSLDPDNPSTAYSFRVKAHSGDGNLLSYSNILNFTRESILLIPDAFSPNGDVHNERFEVKALFVNSFRMSIFNRWGQVVFQTNSATDSWDGNIKGEKAPVGYYLYKIEITDTSDHALSRNGSILLLR